MAVNLRALKFSSAYASIPCASARNQSRAWSNNLKQSRLLVRHASSSSLGSIYATQSGLFKLALPLRPHDPVSANETPSAAHGKTTEAENTKMEEDDDATLFLLHPKQPLSFIGSLIQAEVAAHEDKPPQRVTFHGSSKSSEHDHGHQAESPREAHWASSTELGRFIQEAASGQEFAIHLHEAGKNVPRAIRIRVPTFDERTYYMRKNLKQISLEMQSLLEIKKECDVLALQGARRFAIGGFAGLLGYWGVVYHLTFNVWGWDVMEPVTYLTGLTTVVCGYLWFLYNQKEVSYRSVFEMSSSKRREMLYDQKGFDRQRWEDLVGEAAQLRRIIRKIASDYDVKWNLNKESGDHSETEQEIVSHIEEEDGPKGDKRKKRKEDNKQSAPKFA